ncbi:MAG: hypothetical protein MUC68_18780 [Burkholderiaceae bacterium]|nr:hypothetical protein [Burkholderiaceae bacterium]
MGDAAVADVAAGEGCNAGVDAGAVAAAATPAAATDAAIASGGAAAARAMAASIRAFEAATSGSGLPISPCR